GKIEVRTLVAITMVALMATSPDFTRKASHHHPYACWGFEGPAPKPTPPSDHTPLRRRCASQRPKLALTLGVAGDRERLLPAQKAHPASTLRGSSIAATFCQGMVSVGLISAAAMCAERSAYRPDAVMVSRLARGPLDALRSFAGRRVSLNG